MIDLSKPINDLYAELCVREREMRRELERGVTGCRHCRRPKSDHLPDERCSVDSLSGSFRPVDEKDRDIVCAALLLLEELKKLSQG